MTDVQGAVTHNSGGMGRLNDRRWRMFRLVGAGFAIVLGVVLTWMGYTVGLEQQVRAMRDGAREAAATGDLVLVEIDAHSLQSLSQWPWPRRHHGALLDRLNRAHVPMVAFDVDFSSRSNPVDDAAFAAALRRFGGSVVLPTFRQSRGSGLSGEVENLPIAPLRAHAFLGSVNVFPGKDGVVRTYSYGTVTAGTPRPSVGAMLAGASGHIGEEFPIDAAINPASIPRVSYADLLRNDATLELVRGKRVLVGATAIEMGDRYLVPRHGILPGVVVQALAAETLMQGRVIADWGAWPLLVLAAILVVMTARLRTRSARQVALMSGVVAMSAVPMLGEALMIGSVRVVPALLLVGAGWLAMAAVDLTHTLLRSRLIDSRTGMANATALTGALGAVENCTLVVARFANLDEAIALLPRDDGVHLVQRVAARLTTAGMSNDVHIHGTSMLAWVVPAGQEDEIEEECEALHAMFRSTVSVAGKAFLVTPAFGVASGDGARAEGILDQAAQAARTAHARNIICLRHDQSLLDAASRDQTLLSDLEQALIERQIWVAYQPKYDFAVGRVTAAEALVRWRHPELGAVPPDAFIPLFEQANIMGRFTLYVVDRVMEDIKAAIASNRRAGVAVNISGALLSDDWFMGEFLKRMAMNPEIASAMTAEITESAAVLDSDKSVAALGAISEAGLRISIDDYGTGFSTLSYLKKFPANEIKIDKSFVGEMVTNPKDQIMVRSTIELAHELGFAVVAEGIEDEACLNLLRTIGCDYAQGYFISRPVPANEFFAMMGVDTDLAA